MARILVVDDAAFMRMRLKIVLSERARRSWKPRMASRGHPDRTNEHRPDLVLMDITMPMMDGLTALRTIRERIPAPGRHVLRHGTAIPGHEAIKAGAKDFIVKLPARRVSWTR